MNILETSMAEAVAKEIPINLNDLLKVSTACTTIAVEHAKEEKINLLKQLCDKWKWVNPDAYNDVAQILSTLK